MSQAVFDAITGAYRTDITENLRDPNAIVVDVPEGVDAWRLSMNVETQEVIVKYEGSNNADALVALAADQEAEDAAVLAAAEEVVAARQAAIEASQEEGAEPYTVETPEPLDMTTVYRSGTEPVADSAETGPTSSNPNKVAKLF